MCSCLTCSDKELLYFFDIRFLIVSLTDLTFLPSEIRDVVGDLTTSLYIASCSLFCDIRGKGVRNIAERSKRERWEMWMIQERLNRRRRAKRVQKQRLKQRTKGWFSVTGEFSLCFLQPPLILQAASTYIGLGACVDHMEWAVGQVKASEAARSLQGGSQTQSNESHSEGHVTVTPHPHPPRGQLTMIHAWHNTGSTLINVHGYMVCIHVGAWCHMGLWTANRHDVTQTIIWDSLEICERS